MAEHLEPAWDPQALTLLIKRTTQTATCLAWAPSKSRRCQYHIPNWRLKEASGIWNRLKMQRQRPSEVQIRWLLTKVAWLCVCRKYHTNEKSVGEVVQKWLEKMEEINQRIGEEDEEQTEQTQEQDQAQEVQPQQHILLHDETAAQAITYHDGQGQAETEVPEQHTLDGTITHWLSGIPPTSVVEPTRPTNPVIQENISNGTGLGDQTGIAAETVPSSSNEPGHEAASQDNSNNLQATTQLNEAIANTTQSTTSLFSLSFDISIFGISLSTSLCVKNVAPINLAGCWIKRLFRSLVDVYRNGIDIYARNTAADGLLGCTEVHVARRPIEGECMLCFQNLIQNHNSEEGLEDDDDVGPLVWCKMTCGQNIHRACLNAWHAQEIQTAQEAYEMENEDVEDGDVSEESNVSVVTLLCPFCRQEWQSDCEHDD